MKRSNFKIALIDLNHMTKGVHTNTVPLGLGLIAAYLKKNLKGSFNVRMFKNPHIFLSALKEWKPDVLGITQYSWNSELNLYMSALVRKINPDCFIVAGGPNLPLSSVEKTNYLRNHSQVDLCAKYDGEIPFTELIRRLIFGERKDDILQLPPAGMYSLGIDRKRLREMDCPPPRLKSLDEFGAVYAEGLFNGLLDEGFNPFLQTHRGCPFGCIYCHTSDAYYSKMIFQSVDYFKKDMEYLGRRFAGQHDIALYLANTNFSLFKEDFAIAKVIREIQDKYDWPKNIEANSGKDPAKLLDLLSILKYKIEPSISLQTLTPKVLNKIGRRNIPFKDFVAFNKKVIRDVDKASSTELILSLPGESKRSFLSTLSRVINSGVQSIVIYTLMLLKGTPIASPEYAKHYDYTIKHRIVPRCFSDINGEKIFETEEVVVGTKAMPYKDYLDLRAMALMVTVFIGSWEMFPIRKFLLERKLNVAKWIFDIFSHIKDSSGANHSYKSFLQETKNELFTSRDKLIDFFSRPKNYDLLCDGKFGDNLLRKYKTILLSQNYADCAKLALKGLRRVSKGRLDRKVSTELIHDFKIFLENRDIGYIFREGYRNNGPLETVLNYDIPSWLENKDGLEERLDAHRGRYRYLIKVLPYQRRRLKTYTQSRMNPELSMQMLYRDGTIKDFWPIWKRVKK